LAQNLVDVRYVTVYGLYGSVAELENWRLCHAVQNTDQIVESTVLLEAFGKVYRLVSGPTTAFVDTLE
jgi:hypothetical protein